MKLKYFRILGLVITTIALTSCKGKTEKEIKKTFSKVTTRPNIVFIMSDDHAYQAISAYGHHLNHTPNIDRIAKEGAIFNRGFVTNSICAPSRAAMLTGKHSHINGKVDNFHAYNWDQDNFVKSLQKVGYQTALVITRMYFLDKDTTIILILSKTESKKEFLDMSPLLQQK